MKKLLPLTRENQNEEIFSQRNSTNARLIRSNDVLLQSSFETLLDMVKGYAGIKECSEETQSHLNMVIFGIS